MGISSNHSYSVIDVFEFVRNGTRERLLKVRNPWGFFEWKGEWSDKSPLWTPELKKRLNIEVEDDGLFLISYTDFLKIFTGVEICKANDSFKYVSMKCSLSESKQKFCFIKFLVQYPGEYCFSICQKDKHMFDDSLNYDYSVARMIVAKSVDSAHWG